MNAASGQKDLVHHLPEGITRFGEISEVLGSVVVHGSLRCVLRMTSSHFLLDRVCYVHAVFTAHPLMYGPNSLADVIDVPGAKLRIAKATNSPVDGVGGGAGVLLLVWWGSTGVLLW